MADKSDITKDIKVSQDSKNNQNLLNSALDALNNLTPKPGTKPGNNQQTNSTTPKQG